MSLRRFDDGKNVSCKAHPKQQLPRPANEEAGDILRAKLLAWGPVAQLVEHCTFNAVVAGSNPARLTLDVTLRTLFANGSSRSAWGPMLFLKKVLQN